MGRPFATDLQRERDRGKISRCDIQRDRKTDHAEGKGIRAEVI